MTKQDGTGHDRTGKDTIGQERKRREKTQQDQTQRYIEGMGWNVIGKDRTGQDGAVFDGLSLITL